MVVMLCASGGLPLRVSTSTGLHILTFEQLAARLAGGLTLSVDDQTLRQAVRASLPKLTLGELDSLKALPGMVAAAVETIGKSGVPASICNRSHRSILDWLRLRHSTQQCSPLRHPR